MKTLIIHLSDIHLIKPKAKIDVKPLAVACAQGQKPDNAVLVFSGDFVDRPYQQNFKAFDVLFSELKSQISEELGLSDLGVVVVPGNHDIELGGNHSILQSDLVDNPDKKPHYYEQCLKAEKNVLDFCSRHGCKFINGGIGEKTFDFGDSTFHFLLINSAPFSSLKYDDKEHHFLPPSSALLGRPSSTKKSFEILVSHHRPDWFDYESSTKMNGFVEETAAICLYGHEHATKCYAQISNENKVLISQGGELRVLNDVIGGSFSRIVIDDEEETAEVETMTFSRSFSRFVAESNGVYPLRLNDSKRLKNDFVNDVLNPIVADRIRENDVFVMPFLRSNGDQDDISSLQELADFCLNGDSCYVHGFHNCGKSSLLHRLFEMVRPKAWTVFLECNDCLTSNPEKAVKNAFEQQYYYSALTYQDFCGAPRGEKIIIVDSFEELRGETIKEKYLSYFSDNFGSVVMALSDSSYSAKSSLSVSYFERDRSYEISGLSLEKRRELYSNIAEFYGVNVESDLDIITNCIESVLGLGSVIDTSDPAFLTGIASDIIKDKFYLERDTRNSFSEAFRHSIDVALSGVIPSRLLDDYYSLLSQLAADMAFVYKERCFDAGQLQRAMNNRKELFGIKFQPFNEVLDNLLRSRLIVAEKDKYRFERNSLASFFAAREVVRLYQKGDTKYLDCATEEITYGIYGDIVMFAAYQLQRVDVFFKMQDILSECFKGIEEISYDKKNNEILKKNTTLIPETKEQAETRKQLYKRLDDSNRRAIANAPNAEKLAYEKHEADEWEKAITKSLKLLEISSKAIAGFKTEIEASDRELLLETTISSSLRLINFLFRFTPEDIEVAEKDFQKWKATKIEKMEKEGKSEKEIDKIRGENITHIFYDFLTTTLLNLMTGMARLMTSKTSISFIEDMATGDSFRKLFVLIAYGEYGSSSKFLTYFSDLISNTKDLGFKLILQRVARVFAITHTLSVSELNQLAVSCGYKRDKFYLFTKPNQKK